VLGRVILSSVLLGLVSGTVGTLLYAAGLRRLKRFRGRFLAREMLSLVLLLGISAGVLILLWLVDRELMRWGAGYNPRVLLLGMFVPMGVARIIAERRARRAGAPATSRSEVVRYGRRTDQAMSDSQTTNIA
jgi:type IV secretory pathway TrbD component